MVIVVDGTTTAVEQVRKQLDKLVEVVKVTDISGDNLIARELTLIKVESNPATRSEIIEITDIFRANILDVIPDSIIIEATGDEDKINSLIELVRGFGMIELVRTGCIAMTRGAIGPPRKQRQGQSKQQKSKRPPANQ
jgi:acetolactate synthase-1/3 small subunit